MAQNMPCSWDSKGNGTEAGSLACLGSGQTADTTVRGEGQ